MAEPTVLSPVTYTVPATYGAPLGGGKKKKKKVKREMEPGRFEFNLPITRTWKENGVTWWEGVAATTGDKCDRLNILPEGIVYMAERIAQAPVVLGGEADHDTIAFDDDLGSGCEAFVTTENCLRVKGPLNRLNVRSQTLENYLNDDAIRRDLAISIRGGIPEDGFVTRSDGVKDVSKINVDRLMVLKGPFQTPVDEGTWMHAIARAVKTGDKPAVVVERTNIKPCGDVDYAAPGNYSKDGVYRFPIETVDHVIAARNYANVQKNLEGFTPNQRKHIASRIKSAAKRLQVPAEPDGLSDILVRCDLDGSYLLDEFGDGEALTEVGRTMNVKDLQYTPGSQGLVAKRSIDVCALMDQVRQQVKCIVEDDGWCVYPVEICMDGAQLCVILTCEEDGKYIKVPVLSEKDGEVEIGTPVTVVKEYREVPNPDMGRTKTEGTPVDAEKIAREKKAAEEAAKAKAARAGKEGEDGQPPADPPAEAPPVVEPPADAPPAADPPAEPVVTDDAGKVGRQCPKCSAENKVSRKFCTQCASPMDATAAKRSCGSCKAELDATDRACGECGAMVERVVTTPAPEAEAEEIVVPGGFVNGIDRKYWDAMTDEEKSAMIVRGKAGVNMTQALYAKRETFNAVVARVDAKINAQRKKTVAAPVAATPASAGADDSAIQRLEANQAKLVEVIERQQATQDALVKRIEDLSSGNGAGVQRKGLSADASTSVRRGPAKTQEDIKNWFMANSGAGEIV